MGPQLAGKLGETRGTVETRNRRSQALLATSPLVTRPPQSVLKIASPARGSRVRIPALPPAAPAVVPNRRFGGRLAVAHVVGPHVARTDRFAPSLIRVGYRPGRGAPAFGPPVGPRRLGGRTLVTRGSIWPRAQDLEGGGRRWGRAAPARPQVRSHLRARDLRCVVLLLAAGRRVLGIHLGVRARDTVGDDD